jgi:hypothetical protein
MGTIIEAVACGKLRPSEAQALCSVLKIQRESIEIMEIEQRLKSLENAVKDRKQ